MAKIMLVEDDNNLREIYGARLQAEGHDIVAAKDGEEALALAVKEKPDLIISDVMMPRISGFDMLDILRNAPETKDTKVIMMTALSQAEDKSRADKLGADRYLVKSQVTLEDVANVVREVLEGTNGPTAVENTASVPPPAQTPVEAPPVVPAAVAQPAPVAAPTVEAIANPIVEVLDEPDPSAIQAPPAEEPAAEHVAATAPSTQPAPSAPVASDEQPVPAPTAVTQPVDGTATTASDSSQPAVDQSTPVEATAQPAPTDSSATLPIVEPFAAVPIKVELPQLDEAQTEPATATTATPVTLPVDPEIPQPNSDNTEDASFVGPSLAEALASEESTNGQANQPPAINTIDDTPVATVTNSTPTTVVIEPTQLPPETETEPKDSGVSTEGSSSTTAGMRVIQPINDSTTQPDLIELLAAEERNAAVENPAANSVITPVVPAPETNSEQTPKPPPPKPENNNPINNIAL